jgi:succinoglycan biosynthesis protein ExoU
MTGEFPTRCCDTKDGWARLTGQVDVVIAAWNSADTVERAMLSALDQPEVHTLIVIDDCSTDATAFRAERIAKQHGERVTLSRMLSNRGPAAARNVGLELSTAPWVAILDSDDFFLPERLKKLMSHANDYDFIADDLIQVQDGQEEDERSNLLGRNFDPRQLNLEEFVLGDVNRRGRRRKELGFLKPMMRRSFLSCHQLRYRESLRLGEDYAFYARALALGARFLLIPEGGYVSVERIGSLSGRHTMQDLERLRDFDLDLIKIHGLTPSEKAAIKRHYQGVDARAQWVAVVDAFKARSLSRFVAPFFRSSVVSSSLIWNLAEQIHLRGGRRLADLRRAATKLWK